MTAIVGLAINKEVNYLMQFEQLLSQVFTAAAFLMAFLLLSAVWRSVLRAIQRRGGNSEQSLWFAMSVPGYLLAATGPFYAYCYYQNFALVNTDVFIAARIFFNISILLLVGELIFAIALKYYSKSKPGGEFPSIFRQLIKGLVYLILLLSFLSNTYKIDITPLLTTSAVFTMILGLALQDVLGNFFAGLSVHISPPFRIGDWVEVNKFFGKIIESNWRATTLRLPDSTIVSIPNNHISKNEIQNFSDGSGSLCREFTIGLSYNDSPDRIRRVLLAAANQVEEIYTRPAPLVLLKEFDEHTINYSIRFWIANDEAPDKVTGQLASRIWYRLKREGLSIPFPIKDVFVHQEKDDRQKVLEHRLALIANIDFMASLDSQLKTFIAERLEECWYETDEEIVIEGSFDTDFYIIDRGRVSVYISSAGRKPVAELHEGDFFGEMSLLTGEKRSASVVAKQETRLLKLNRDTMAHLLSANEQLAEKLSHSLAERSNKNAQLLSSQAETRIVRGKKSGDENVARAAILRRICSFFKL